MRDSVALWSPSPFFFPNREGHIPRFLVIHGTAGGSSAQGIASWFADQRAQVSTHYVIGQDGVVVACVNEEDGAWSNGFLSAGHDAFWDTLQGVNPNDVTISLEFVKSAIDNSNALTDAQKAAGYPLIKRICERHNIPMRAADASGGICAHASLDPVNRRDCPGLFDWAGLYSFLQQEETVTLTLAQASHYFTLAPGNDWYCPSTNCTIGGAILQFYTKFGGDALCGLTYLGLPKSGEVGVPGHPGVVEQTFERATLRYDAAHVLDNPPGSGSVYLTHQDTVKNPQLASVLQQLIDSSHKVALLEEQLQGMV